MGKYFESFSEFLSMAPYGGFVWSAYGIVAVVTIGVWLFSLRRLARAQRAQRTQRAEASLTRLRRKGSAK